MPAPIILKTRPAEAMILGGSEFVLTTTRLNSGKDNRYDFLHHPAAPFKPH